jgi:AraC-like DNA-binding protein
MEKDKNIEEPIKGKTDSFFGDRRVVLSKNQIKFIKETPLISGLFISDIGFYPHAMNHYRKRKKGITEHILIYCIDGNGSILVENKTYNLVPNSYFVIPAHKVHTYWASEQSPWSIYWLHFGGERSIYFQELFGQIISIHRSLDSRIDDRIKLFNELLTTLESGFSKENINFANLCLGNLLASFFYVQTYRSAKGFQSSNPIDKSIFFMQKNINKTLKISDISDYVKLSESHLSKIFRNKTGSSPLDYFINLKMQEGIRLLTNQSLRVKEVAYRLGYNDPYYFTRIFTKHIGSSPGSFIKMCSR